MARQEITEPVCEATKLNVAGVVTAAPGLGSQGAAGSVQVAVQLAPAAPRTQPPMAVPLGVELGITDVLGMELGMELGTGTGPAPLEQESRGVTRPNVNKGTNTQKMKSKTKSGKKNAWTPGAVVTSRVATRNEEAGTFMII